MKRFRGILCRWLCGAPRARPVPTGAELAGIIEDLDRQYVKPVDPASIHRTRQP